MKGNAKEKGSKVAGKATTITKPTAKSGNKKKAESKKVDVAAELFAEQADADDEVADKLRCEGEWKKKKREFEQHESIEFPPHIMPSLSRVQWGGENDGTTSQQRGKRKK